VIDMKLVLLIQAAATWAMFGLIWFVQIVHYPLFGKVGVEQFSLYGQLHQRLTTWVVAPLMLVELGAALYLCFVRPAELPEWMVWTGMGLVVVIWLSTAFLQIPAHEALATEFSAEQHAKLVHTNWVRTVAWSARGVLVLLMMSALSKP